MSWKIHLHAELHWRVVFVCSLVSTLLPLMAHHLSNPSLALGAVAQKHEPAHLATPRRPLLIAHRGASAYAPEHTQAAYALAIEQGADYIEQDLQLTKDGALICAHDAELSRTTNVADIFPERATLRDPEGRGSLRKGWYAPDFTLAEIKRLDGGSWFNRSNPFAAREEFVGQKILTLEEVIQLFGGKTRLYIEMKYVPFYESLGKDMVGALVSVLKEKKIGPPGGQPGAQPLPPVFVQSFTKSSLLRLRDLAPEYPRIQLLPMEDQGRQLDTKQVTSRLAKEVARYASGVGPAKEMLKSASDVAVFHRAGLQIHPFTFRGSTSASKRSPLDGKESNGRSLEQNIVEEIQRYLRLGIDGGFTDYPPVWKTAAPQLP